MLSSPRDQHCSRLLFQDLISLSTTSGSTTRGDMSSFSKHSVLVHTDRRFSDRILLSQVTQSRAIRAILDIVVTKHPMALYSLKWCLGELGNVAEAAGRY